MTGRSIQHKHIPDSILNPRIRGDLINQDTFKQAIVTDISLRRINDQRYPAIISRWYFDICLLISLYRYLLYRRTCKSSYQLTLTGHCHLLRLRYNLFRYSHQGLGRYLLSRPFTLPRHIDINRNSSLSGRNTVNTAL